MSFSFNFFSVEGPAEAVGPVNGGASSLEFTASHANPQVIPVEWLEFERLPATTRPLPPSHEYSHGIKRALVDADAVSGVKGLDVVPSQYEGGAKTWECTSDVMAFLSSPSSPSSSSGKELELPPNPRVMDLGCGAALLACYAIKKWSASRVVCQDLNASVLRDVSTVNLLLNSGLAVGPVGSNRGIELVAGSWSALVEELRKAREPVVEADASTAATTSATDKARSLLSSFDCILTSEVLYREQHYPDLAAIIASCLAVPSGVAVIGSKRNYFGAELGGSVPAFVDFITKGRFESPATGVKPERYALAASVVRSFEDGKSMTRDVLKLEWKRLH